MPNAAAIYARSADDPDLDRQITDCRQLARSKGWPVAETYVDDDSVGRASRPALRRLLDDLNVGRIDAVVMHALDRLPRTASGLEAVLAVCGRAGVRDLATVTGDVDLSTVDGLTAAHVLASVTAHERATRSQLRARRSVGGAPAGSSSAP
ncbi:MAG: serine recombinase [Acidimicrobiaceae bacterium]|nr:serine recombinase [Acidimicrobiaceae bacterium]